MATVATKMNAKTFNLALVVEELSSNYRHAKLTRRVTQFLANGAQMVWVVDPEDQAIVVYRPHKLPVVLGEKDELPDSNCRVAEFFTRLE